MASSSRLIATPTLWARATEADAWCAARVRIDQLAHCARTPELRPPSKADGGLVISAASVDEVAARRASALRASGWDQRASAGFADGRLLLFDPGQSAFDGAAEVESRGFFDSDNTPPWDTWLAFVEETVRADGRWRAFDAYLVCWIPGGLVDLAARAIEVNPERCLRWADELDTPFLDGIRRARPCAAPDACA